MKRWSSIKNNGGGIVLVKWWAEGDWAKGKVGWAGVDSWIR